MLGKTSELMQVSLPNWLDYFPWSLISIFSLGIHLSSVFSYEVLLRFEVMSGTIKLSGLYH